MQRQPGYPGAPGMPGMPGMPMQNGFGGPGMPPQGQGFGPVRRPSWAGPCFSGPQPMPPQQQPQGPGCFMPAATIRKISNTMAPPQFFNN